MKVTVIIDPERDGPEITITAPALTDNVKALAARLEGGGILTGWTPFSAATGRRRW